VHPYHLIVALAALVCAASAGGIFLRAPERLPSRLLGVLLAGFAIWALAQAMAGALADPRAALHVRRFSVLGWAFLGPLALHLFMEMAGERSPRLIAVRRLLYALCVPVAPLTFASDWVLRGVEPGPWTWRLVPGPLFGPVGAVELVGVALGGIVGLRSIPHLSEGERSQVPWVALAVALPLATVTLTDLLFVLWGVPFPPLGAPSFALLAVLASWSVVHFGYTLIDPGTFAREILGLLPDGVALLHPDERIRYANVALARLCGVEADALPGRTAGELLAWSFEADALDEVDCELETASGAHIPVSVTWSVLRDRQGNAIGKVLVVRDLREVADLRRRLLTAARLAAVGELAAGIAHEINNPLAFVRSNLSQLQGRCKVVGAELERHCGADVRCEALGDAEDLLAESLEGVDRAASIVRGVNGIAHSGSAAREPADVAELLEDVLTVASPQLRGRVRIERDYGEVPPVPCAPQQLKQVFLNLVVNAGQAIGERGVVRVTTRAREGEVVVEVCDDGCGIAQENLDRIFDPFFTTKRVGEGTGLGLGIAYRIVKAHGGEIEVDSRPGQGSRFRVRLPAS
jgi:signal transduction histidine kinase